MSNYIIHDGELYHYGRKGMKWGQHIYGKVKSAGSSVRRKVGESLARRKEEKRVSKLMSKPVRKLNESELKERTARAAKEKALIDMERSIKSADQQSISAGKKFISSMASEVLVPALISSGKNALTNLLNDKFDNILDPEKFERDALKNEVDMLDLKVKKKDYLNKLNSKPDQDDELAKASKRAGYTKTIYEAMNAKRKYERDSANDTPRKDDPIETYFTDDDSPKRYNVNPNLLLPSGTSKKKRKKRGR